MQYKTLAMLAVATATATLASAENIVTFVSMDDTDRTVYFTPNSGLASINATSVPAGESVSVSIPEAWIGNFYSVSDGAENTAGMLGEVSFNSWGGLTFFDVSAIVNPNDKSGVYQMYPVKSQDPISGCESFACSNAYYAADDVQTKSTESTHLITTLGAGDLSISKRSVEQSAVENLPREAVTNPRWMPMHSKRISNLRWAQRAD